MALKGDDVTVAASATLLFTATSAASATNPQRIVVQNNTSTACTVGASDVADASNGIVLPASGNNKIEIHLTQPNEEVYAISASGNISIQYLVDNV